MNFIDARVNVRMSRPISSVLVVFLLVIPLLTVGCSQRSSSTNEKPRMLVASETSEDPTSPSQPWLRTTSIDLASAVIVAQTGIDASRKLGLRGAVAVVNSAGQLIVLMSDDGATQQFAEGAIAKAWTSANLRASTKDLQKQISKGDQDDAQLTHIQGALFLWGGVPLKVDDQIVGAVGVACGTGSQDNSVAQAAAAKYTQRLSGAGGHAKK